MTQRGKFQSLTMVNWNGFFARTFDIDNLVTTLSGGNGAGKSTTMAAFITAMIPDQSLLHFRNTTEAGSSNASRDKGLHGKLKPGACYAALDVVNSRNQRILFGVRLQQVAGRDKKVDIKPFIVQGLPSGVKPTDILIENVSANQVRVRQLNEVKDALADYDTAHYKAFNSVTDYHAQMFEFGALPKKLRNSSDRSKFYRLIEASLYGGISSAITKSLRDYLLPQNGGVKKAFQDMEVALRENRMTLEAIKLTQRDRDLFKHLITESTNYVASDYMRHANERRKKLELALQRRGELLGSRRQLDDFQSTFGRMTDELDALTDSQTHLEQDYQAASDHLQLVQTAVRQQEKVERYQEDLEELAIRLEEQMMVVEEATEQLAMAEEQAHLSEEEVDSLKTQLADYQQALDMQQTRALQYQQAVKALEKARELTGNEELSQENATEYLGSLKAQEEAQTSELLSLKHKLDLSSAAAKQFERGLQLVRSIAGEVDRSDAGAKAREVIVKGREFANLAANAEQLTSQHRDLERQMRSFQQAKTLSEQYQRKFNETVASEEAVELEMARQQERLETAEEAVGEQAEKVRELQRSENEINAKAVEFEKVAPAWIAAQEALEKLAEQTEAELYDNQAVLDTMQRVMADERETISTRDKLQAEKQALEAEIERLAQPGGSDDARLQSLADTLGGTLLSEIYDDITIDDAPYFSALYGPARHAIVVPDLKGIKEKLLDLDDCPEDLYIIEGDADGFDDSVFDVEELEDAVCVHLNDRQLRYSRFPKIPLFGRAAREHRLEILREKREELVENYAKASFDAQKLQRLTQSFNQFVSNHMNVAFNEDPEAALKDLREKRASVQRQLAQLRESEQQVRSQLTGSKEAIALLNKLQHVVNALEDETLEGRLEEVESRLSQADEARHFTREHGKALAELENLVSTLDADPEQFDALNAAYQQADEALQSLKKTLFALSDLVERRHHFGYADAVELLDKSSELNEQLKAKLVDAERARTRSREHVKQVRDQVNQYNQLLASLKSSHQAKQETVTEFKRELVELGVRADVEAEERARIRRDELNAQLSQSRSRKGELEKGLTSIELEMKSLVKTLKKACKEYTELRTFVVNAKAGWMDVLKIARSSNVEKQLNRREMAYMSADELRSLSDKSLGALRLAVADNETLRDALRASEDMARPERKVLFYVAVYQHLRERIRHDIIRTDDPVEAIEEMEVELARLTEELTQREKRLAISSESVANIIRKTIQREQNRIRLLNQGLSNIAFGQVKGVRLNVSIRDTHAQLLAGLSENAEQHQDLFGNNRLTFSEAMAKLFQRLNPHIDLGQRSPQVLGEELLDYRNYLELGIEVNRGTDGWLQAESGALSTGEAIGTGQAILLMVVQSWEEESRRLRGKDVIPCRLLFLDEAARLDAKSISTLFELCHRLDMQLLIAAPENISPEQGTTYKLVRKIFNDKEHVHVVGLRGFGDGAKTSNLIQEALEIAE
ncbi:chromosome partition protein MukB [Grimontia kaedaensis]|uniref:Chromosome partition protein MukB n=1 Tax=Grimontia kaedaensis TaxID=2872157 RepID=A0ABY4WNU1_9GAMM|nr:chromosome partition protein MukB [Grimontia kaedaensis]USH01239.1 chromosome partition protein MukB [Grimontia kaedaensis]